MFSLASRRGIRYNKLSCAYKYAEIRQWGKDGTLWIRSRSAHGSKRARPYSGLSSAPRASRRCSSGRTARPSPSGSFDWENRLEDGVWTYHLEDVWHGIQESYKNLASSVQEKYGVTLRRLKGLGFSAMMHGYLAFDRGRPSACAVPHVAQHDDRGRGGRTSPRASASISRSAGASRTCIRRF